MRIAVEGCAHGELDKIYDVIEHLEKKNDLKVDLLIICGDFQAVRNRSDLQCMAVPRKYQKLNTFYKYYSGEKLAPILTIFVGGNHEASNYLSELPYGGWVCPNIYYMGYANVVNVGGLRIAGLSGIYKGQDYLKGHFEALPYTESTKRSVYHVRNLDVFRLKQIKQPVDVCISHDWPRGVYNHGDKDGLLKFKPFFRDDIENDKLGSRPAEELLYKLKPAYWFAAHMHCRFAAVVSHEDKSVTKFLALDKCLPRRRFLQILEIGDETGTSAVDLHYDKEWLAVLRSTNFLLNVCNMSTYMPGPGCSERWDFSASREEMEEAAEFFPDGLVIPKDFVQTATPHSNSSENKSVHDSPTLNVNPQTTRFCKLLGIDDPVEILMKNSPRKKEMKNYSYVDDLNVTNVSQVSLDPDSSHVEDEEEDNDDDDSSLEGDSSLPEPSSFDFDSTGSSGFFYIDTRPCEVNFASSSPIAPKKAQLLDDGGDDDDDIVQEEKSSFSDHSACKMDFESFPEFKEQSDNEPNIEKSDEDATSMKPFKRRNQSIYTSNDDGED